MEIVKCGNSYHVQISANSLRMVLFGFIFCCAAGFALGAGSVCIEAVRSELVQVERSRALVRAATEVQRDNAAQIEMIKRGCGI